MRAFTFQEEIRRSPAVVWAALTDLPAAPEWRSLIRSMATEDGGPLRVGQRVVVTLEMMGERRTRLSETIALEPERRWALASSTGGLRGVFDYRLEPSSNGTRVTMQLELAATGLRAHLTRPLVALSERRLRRATLARFKRFVESRWPAEGPETTDAPAASARSVGGQR